jgi:ribonuclease HII
MGILIGMDEAGYGPNIGPLVVAATAWEVGEEVGGRRSEVGADIPASRSALASAATPNLAVSRTATQRHATRDLYDALQDVVGREACGDSHIAIADSKLLYKPGGGLRQLERGVHATLATVDRPAPRWSTLVDTLAADPGQRERQLPWHDGFDCPLPVDTEDAATSRLGGRLREMGEAAGVRPLAIRARLVFPEEFNDLVEYHQSKGAALSHVTIRLLREMIGKVSADADPAAAATSPIHVVCDKHGGRNRYHSLLQHHFPDDWIDVLLESRTESRYHWGASDAGVEVAFCTGGEEFLPAALASMTAKYVRELAMRAWNQFWCARLPGLRPTAGYPLDAKRFKAEITATQRMLGIDDRLLWRNR